MNSFLYFILNQRQSFPFSHPQDAFDKPAIAISLRKIWTNLHGRLWDLMASPRLAASDGRPPRTCPVKLSKIFLILNQKFKNKWKGFAPDVVSFAVCFAFAEKAGTAFVEVLFTVGALEAVGVPGEVRRYAEDELIVDLSAASDAHRSATLLPWNKVNTPHWWEDGKSRKNTLRLKNVGMQTLYLTFIWAKDWYGYMQWVEISLSW